MNAQFDALPWHDAQMLDVFIDRRNPGLRDEIRLSMKWPDETHAIVSFRECYGLIAQMNFGVISDERVLSAQELDSDPELSEMRRRWQLLDVSLEGLRCYRIETASTASVIKVYASTFDVV
jgi:hypothetical protein